MAAFSGDDVKSCPLQLLAVLALCLFIRSAVVIALDQLVTVDREVDVYSTLAKNMAAGNGFVLERDGHPVVWRAPLYPALLAAIFTIAGDADFTPVLIVQLLLDAVAATLLYMLCIAIFDRRTGIIAAIIFAAYPISAYYTLRLLPESTFTMMLTAMTVALSLSIRERIPAWFAFTGIIGGLAILVKPVALPVILFVACVLIFVLRVEVVRRFQLSAIMLIAVAVIVGPWTVRNYQKTGMLVPVATGGGYALWYGNNLMSDGREDFQLEGSVLNSYVRERQSILAPYHPEIAAALQNREPILSMDSHSQTTAVRISPEADQAFLKAGIDGILSNPVQTGWLMTRKLARFWLAIFFPKNKWAQVPVAIAQFALLALATFGAYRAAVNGRDISAPMAVLVGLTMTHVVFNATLRYSVPLLPIVSMLAAYGFLELYRRVSTSNVVVRSN